MTIIKLSYSLLLAFFLSLLIAGGLRAEFLQTNHGVFQNLSLREKVVVSYSHPGIFVLSGPPVDIQLFDIAVQKKGEGSHFFVEYDPQRDRYTALHIGGEQFRITGNFTLEMGRVRLAVDNNIPYLTVVVEEESSILGFRGLRNILNLAQEPGPTVLEANQFNQYQGKIVPYQLDGERLLLRGQEVTRRSIGLVLTPPDNVCLHPQRVFYLTEGDMATLRGIAGAQTQSAELEAAVKRNKGLDPYDESLVLQATNRAVITISVLDGRVQRLRLMKNRFLNRSVCLIEDVDF